MAGARPGKVAATFLRERLRRSRAAADVAAAHALDEELPRLGEALAAGEVSREHVDIAVRTLKRIPQHLRDKKRDEIDEWVTGISTRVRPRPDRPAWPGGCWKSWTRTGRTPSTRARSNAANCRSPGMRPGWW